MSAINFNGSGSGSGGGNIDIDQILSKIHQHANKAVIDLFSIKENVLYFNDKPIINSLGNILANNIIETADKKFVEASEKNALNGVKDNIQNTLDVLKSSLRYIGTHDTYSLLTVAVKAPVSGNIAFVLKDENNNNSKTVYIYDNNKWNLVHANTEIKASSITQEANLNFVTGAALAIVNSLSTDKNNKLLWNDQPLASSSTAGAFIKDDIVGIDSVYSSSKVTSLVKNLQPKLTYLPENASNKGVPNGHAPLNNLGKVDEKYLPSVAYTVNSLTAMNNIANPKNGNVCYITTSTEFYLYVNGWTFIAKGNSGVAGKNNLGAIRNPLSDDDSLAGYAVGNIWINSASFKAFICTGIEPGNAKWELMSGSTVLNVSEIIPVRLDPTSYVLDTDRYKFSITKTNFDPASDYIELSINGIELDNNIDYTVEEDDAHTNIYINKVVNPTDAIFGEIYKNSLGTAKEQMMKYDYDSNNNGKVDYAEISDITKNFSTFIPNSNYSKNQIIIEGNRLLKAKDHFTSVDTIDLDDWIVIEAKANDISEFTTDDLIESVTKKYVTPEQITDIGKIQGMLVNINTNATNISGNTTKLGTAITNIQDLYKLLNSKALTELADTPNEYIANATLKVNKTGTGINFEPNPTYPIKSIIDSTNTVYTSIDKPLFKNMIMSKYDTVSNTYEFRLDALTTDLKDMPTLFEHGKILTCDANSNKYVLASSEDLTMSKENFTKAITSDDWKLNVDSYETLINHQLCSDALIVALIDLNKRNYKEFSYTIVDKQNIKLTSVSPIEGTVVINCSLGVSNGYWENALDLSKLEFVDDTQIRLDRGYSSNRIEKMFELYAKKADYYTKTASDLLYSTKNLEHSHNNMSVLNKISSNSYNEVLFDGKKLLTSIESSNIVIKNSGIAVELTEVYNALDSVVSDTILASEFLVKNAGADLLKLVIYDEAYELINVEVLPGDIQKYQLGISKNTKVQLQGQYEYRVTISAL